MNNRRFATAVHILTLLARSPGEWLNSDWIAGSINMHPVIVRKELGVMRKQGWVISKKGKEGGCRLNVSSEAISLSDVYIAVKNSEVLGRKNLNPNPHCPVGRDINKELEELFSETDALVSASLEKKTLKGFTEQFQ